MPVIIEHTARGYAAMRASYPFVSADVDAEPRVRKMRRLIVCAAQQTCRFIAGSSEAEVYSVCSRGEGKGGCAAGTQPNIVQHCPPHAHAHATQPSVDAQRFSFDVAAQPVRDAEFVYAARAL